MRTIIKKDAIFLIAAFAVFLVSYFRVPLIFFQQDEILGFGLFIKEGWKIMLSGFADSRVTHFVPITMSISYGLYNFFGLNHWIYNLIALLFHLVNGLLVYLIAKRVLSRALSALVAVLIFFSSSVAAQLIMWPVINLNSVSLTFALFCWLLLIDKKILPKLEQRARFWVLSLLLLLALFSVEYSAGLILFIPLVVFLTEKGSVRKKISLLSPFLIIAASYLLFRFIPLISGGGAGLELAGGSPFLTKIFNQVTTYFGQLFFEQPFLLTISKIIIRIAQLPYKEADYIENYMVPAVSSVLGVLLIGGSLFLFKYLREKSHAYANNFLLTTLFITFSSLPFLLVPGATSSLSTVSSRYMYFGVSGMAIFVAFIYDVFADPSKKARSVLLTIFVFFLIFYGTSENYTKAKTLYAQGSVRLNILNSIIDAYKILPKKAVFYTESDTSYYALPQGEKIFPFQSGLGQTLLVFYSRSHKLPQEFYPGDYLWDITSQGYKEVGEWGFGFFRNFALFSETIKKNRISEESVFAFRYSSDTNAVEDMAEEVKGRLAGYLAPKREVNPRLFVASPSINAQDTSFMFDRKRDTFWNSKVPYVIPQTIDIDLGGSRKIAQVRIDSYNNKDQNEVGYEVLTSQDGKDWKTVFFARRYPPGGDRYVDLFIEPKMVRSIRIQQIGFHRYASWVIHELQLYEATN